MLLGTKGIVFGYGNVMEHDMMKNVLDLFCGAGGLSYGFKLAGYNIFGGIDFDKSAIETHRRNFDSKYDICGNIENISDEEIREKFYGKIDVIIGGPPCQGFSSANRNEPEKDDPRNKLFFEFIRFVEILQPKAFVIENVKEILTKDNGYAKDRIVKITSELGYKVNYKILLSSDYGVPQNRRRAIFVGIREDNGAVFNFNTMTKSDTLVTVYDAIGDLYYSKGQFSNAFLDYVRDTNGVIYNHEKPVHSEIVVNRIAHVPQGGNWKDIPENLWKNKRNNRHSSAYRRLDFSKPSITIDTGHMNYFHPIENRTPTVRESARLQSFPDSFIFYGNRGEQLKQVGNAVPPLLGKAIAVAIKDYIEVLK